MAKLMTVTTSDGLTVENAYWYPELQNRNKRQKFYYIVFMAYKDKSTKDGHGSPLQVTPKQYMVNAEEYDAYFSDSVLRPNGIDPSKHCYAYADAKLDTDSGQKDESGHPVLVSFFANATDDI